MWVEWICKMESVSCLTVVCSSTYLHTTTHSFYLYILTPPPSHLHPHSPCTSYLTFPPDPPLQTSSLLPIHSTPLPSSPPTCITPSSPSPLHNLTLSAFPNTSFPVISSVPPLPPPVTPSSLHSPHPFQAALHPSHLSLSLAASHTPLPGAPLMWAVCRTWDLSSHSSDLYEGAEVSCRKYVVLC